MAKALTVKYEQSFPLERGMRESFSVTVATGGESAAEAFERATLMVLDARARNEELRKGAH